MRDSSKQDLARAKLPLTRQLAYLDTGSVGPVSTIYADSLARSTDEDLRRGRAHLQRFDQIEAARIELRSEIAGLLGARPAEIELTQGTADAIKSLVDRYPWKPGDEILTTRLEYPACANAIARLTARGDVSLQVAEVPAENADQLDWLERCVSPSTRLIAFSGVAYTTGQRLPIEEIAEFATARGIHTLVDGAQLIGAGELLVDRTQIDFVAMPLQKWLCGPEGLGALYVREGAAELAPSQRNPVHGLPVLEATIAQLAWMREELGWPWIYARIRELSDYTRAALENCPAAELITGPDKAGLLAFHCAPTAIESILKRFKADNLVVRHRPELDLFRISTGFFNTEEEVDRCIAALP